MRDAPLDLLARLTRPDDDDEYAAAAADRRDSGVAPGPLRMVVFGAAVLVLAVLITVSGLQTRAGQSADDRDRTTLLARIDAEQADVAAAQARVDELVGEVSALRGRSAAVGDSVDDVETRLDELAVLVGTEAADGPGVRVTVDDAAGSELEGMILDTDLQLLVNGLWQAGAEAVAVNGQRLTALSAIRTAGEAITVNFRSLSPPYVVSALGDPDVLPARLLETPAGQSFVDLRSNFGIGFEIETAAELSLPAAGRLRVQRAAGTADGAAAGTADGTAP